MDIDLDGSPPVKTGKELKLSGGRQQVAITVDKLILERLDRWAKRRGQTRAGCMNFLVTEGLDRWDKADVEAGVRSDA